MATNRTNKFYQPSLYKASPTTTMIDSPYGFVQIAVRKVDPGAVSETFEDEYKKRGGSTNVIARMEQMDKYIESDIHKVKRDEESAQKDRPPPSAQMTPIDGREERCHRC